MPEPKSGAPTNEMVALGQLEIARALGRTPGLIYRMMMSLEERGYVMRKEGTGKQASVSPVAEPSEGGFPRQLDDFSGVSKTERERLLKTLSQLEGATHHQTNSILTERVTDISVPEGVPGSDVAGALVISYLSGTKSGEKNAPRYLKALLASAAEINRNLGIAR